MATDFWASTHYKRWIVDRPTIRRARELDLLYVDDPIYLEYFPIYFGTALQKLGKRLGLRQRVIATATIFFRRFYLKNAYCETDSFLVAATCFYVAAKAEESPIHIKTIISESRSVFAELFNVRNFPTDNAKIAEMEFYLVDDLECDLTIFHPYRTLLTLCKTESGSDSNAEESEAGEVGSVNPGNNASFSASGSLGVGIGVDEGSRYWGSDEGKLELPKQAIQTAWRIINDTYRSDICLLYPPHLIAIAAIYLTQILTPETRATITPLLESSNSFSLPTSPNLTEEPQKPRRSTRNATLAPSTPEKKPQQDPIAFLAELSVSLPLIGTISQEIISFYTLWSRYDEDGPTEPKSTTSSLATPGNSSFSIDANTSDGGIFLRGDEGAGAVSGEGSDASHVITGAFLCQLVNKMREQRIMDVAHGHRIGYGNLGMKMTPGVHGRSVAVNKMLERAQAAG